MTKFVHLTLQDALEQNRMKEFMAQYKGIKTAGGGAAKSAKPGARAPQPLRPKGARPR